MFSGRLAAEAAEQALVSGDARALRRARKQFMKEHGRVFWVLGIMQTFWYRNDKMRERFVSMCGDRDVQRLTWEILYEQANAAARPDGARAHLLQGPRSPLQTRAAMIELLSGRGAEIAVAAAAVSVVALAGGLMTDVGDWYESLTFPSLRPPNWLFGPAWTLIFVLTAASGVIAWEHGDTADRSRLVALFAINGLLNILWSPLFFRLRRPDWAFYELLPFWLSVLALVIALFRI